tara:strand:+ start:201 stop:2420 length:2220 start_codon:yes stop_codon:yes gene_type:complete
MAAGKEQLIQFQRRWQALLYSEILLYAFGVFVFTYFIVLHIGICLLITLLVVGFLIFFKSPWRKDINKTVNYIDANFKEASYSSGLLLVSEEQLSSLSKLQKHRISQQLQSKLKSTLPPNNIKTALLVMVLLIGIGYVNYKLELFEGFKISKEKTANENKINFIPLDSIHKKELNKLELISQKITISYPSYTNITRATLNNPNIKALVNSRISWQLEFKGEVSEVVLELLGNTYPLESKKGGYTTGLTLETSGFYNFRFKDKENRFYVSDLYSLEAINDEAPLVEITGIPQYTYFDFGDDKQINFQTNIKDDYGMADAYIIATVSKGSGESVKFREEKIEFNAKITRGTKNLELSKKILLDDLKMEVGDELYFYVEALDQKQPKSNITRSETYFAVIKDTTTTQFAVEGTLGVDQMPDYFRSQRQLIIDTEKLIKDKPKLTNEEFKFKSNELGFDQKALRLKYGQFMGDESEMAVAPDENVVEETKQNETDTSDDQNLLAGYTHDHDGSNEAHLVPEKEEEKNDPLHEYLHNHDDPEESTLFEESLKTKLRKALDIMWDAELHLRLYEPEKSLPYQYKALKLIQEIKNSARIYVHRIGFDPPPIKEDKRLTGDIKKIKDFQKNESTSFEETFPFIRKAIIRLENFINKNVVYSTADQELFNAAGNELAAKAITEPGKYLATLQKLKWLTENAEYTIEQYRALQKSLLAVLPKADKSPGLRVDFQEDINTLFLKELNAYE